MKSFLWILAALFALGTGGLAAAGTPFDTALAAQRGKKRQAASPRDSDPWFEARRTAVNRQWLRDRKKAGRRGRVRPPRPKPGRGRIGSQGLIASADFTYLPSGDTTDGRFICIAGTQGLSTLTTDLFIRLSATSDVSSLTLGLFDGDTGGMWDTGTSALQFDLFADPEGDGGVTGPLIDTWDTATTPYPDNAWLDRTITPPASAQTPNGNYFFVLRVRLAQPTTQVLSCFKLRTNTSIRMQPQFSFNFIAWLSNVAEAQVIYPDYPALTNPTYDGSWNFFVYVPAATPYFEMWDGDSDHGNSDGTGMDTDDPNTSTSDPPWWSFTYAFEPEGAAGAAPRDDTSNLPYLRAPGIQYSVTTPTGERFVNTNPSGDEEWERFKLDTVTSVGADQQVSSLPAGVYQVTVEGMDLLNLNAMRFDYDLLGVTEDGRPVQPVLPYSLGDRVFFDSNQNGIYDPGEDTNGNGVLDKETDLNGNNIAETEDANGNGILDDGEDTLIANGILDVEDLNGNGILDNEDTIVVNGVLDGEVGAGNVLMYLLDDAGAVLSTTRTDGGGRYSFPVEPGTYQVQVAVENFTAGGPLEGYSLTTSGPGNPSGTNPLSGNVPKNNTNNLDYDFGYYRPGDELLALGDRVWLDLDGDGLQDSDEPGLANVNLELWQGGSPVAFDTTDAAGNYLFSGLTDNTTYTVKVVSGLPANVSATYDLDGVASVNEATVTLAGSVNLNVDFGYNGSNTLGDRVWLDRNANGVLDAGESGIGSVGLVVRGDTNTDGVYDFEVRKTTDGTGTYTVPGLPPGNYRVEVDVNTLPYGLLLTADPDDASVDPDTPGRSALSFAGVGGSNLLQDFGYVGVGTIEGQVWSDTDCDGVLDGGEPGIDAITVSAHGDFDEDGVTDLTLTTTTSTGTYSFPNVPAGVYQIVVDTSGLGSVTQTYDLDGVATPSRAQIILLPRETRSGVNFGYCASTATGSVGNFIWYDADGDGVQDAGEPGQTGVTVELWAVGGMTALQSTTTISDGAYLFSNVAAGQYYVRFVLPTPVGTETRYNFTSLGAGSAGTDSDANATLDGDGSALTARTAEFNLLAGENNLTLDAGVIIAACISGYVVNDANRDGNYRNYPVVDGGEQLTSLANIPVRIVPPTGAAFTVYTTSTGTFGLDDLAPGTYQITVDYATASQVGQPLNGLIYRTIDPDGIGTPDTAAIGLQAGEQCRDVIFGYSSTVLNLTSAFRTQTQGGWGAEPRGGNAGGFLHTNWSAVFGTSSLALGRKKNPGVGNISSINRLILTSAQAVTNFLPQGGTPARLAATYTDPLITEAGVFAGQLTAAELAVRFSDAGITRSGLGNLKLNFSGNPYHGKTVYNILDEAHKTIATDFNPTGTISELNDALATINQNFVDGKIDNGNLVP